MIFCILLLNLDIQACIPAALATIHNFTCHHKADEEDEDGKGMGKGMEMSQLVEGLGMMSMKQSGLMLGLMNWT